MFKFITQMQFELLFRTHRLLPAQDDEVVVLISEIDLSRRLLHRLTHDSLAPEIQNVLATKTCKER